MGVFYAEKIKRLEINNKTGEPWKFEDVPSLWKKKTEVALAEMETE